MIYRSYTTVVPTCTDGIKNGNELGIDCGGSCALACMSSADDIAVLWSRSFQVIPGRYNAVAYLENHNKDLAVNKIRYSFRFADKDNLYLGTREGVAYVPPGQKFAVFERGIELNTAVPVYTTFSFKEVPTWITVSEQKINQIKLLVSGIVLSEKDSAPHLSADIQNDSLFDVPQVSVVAILYDAMHNAISASSTLIDELGRESTQTLDFTWPEPFKEKVVTKEIIPVYNIFNVKLK